MADDKKGGAAFRWIVRLIVLAALAYFFHPLYMPLKATQPASTTSDDSITWRFMEEPKSDGIYQELTLFRDGRNTITITRPMGDPDLPDGGGWNPKRQGEGDDAITTFSKQDIIPADRAKSLFTQAIDRGLLDLQNEAAVPGQKLTVSWKIGGQTGTRNGPSFIPRVYDWFPPRWKNRIRWQQQAFLLKDDSALKDLISRRDIILVNE